MLDFISLFYTYIAALYTAFNVPVIGSVGYCDLVIGFLFIFLVIAVFWKGARA